MIDDMTARRFTEDTQRDYVRYVRTFAAFLGRSPDTATREDLRRFQLHMAQQQFSPGTINAAIAGLRFFFNGTLERPDLVRPLTIVNKPRKAPVVLSQEEVARLLEAAPGLKYKAAQRRLWRRPARVRGRLCFGVGRRLTLDPLVVRKIAELGEVVALARIKHDADCDAATALREAAASSAGDNCLAAPGAVARPLARHPDRSSHRNAWLPP